MGTHIQRKRFEHPTLASAAAEGFRDPTSKIPGVDVIAHFREEDGRWWVYVTQSGEFVTGDEPLLPDYKRVA